MKQTDFTGRLLGKQHRQRRPVERNRIGSYSVKKKFLTEAQSCYTKTAIFLQILQISTLKL